MSDAVDALVVLVVGAYGLVGYSRGFLQGIGSLVGMIVTLGGAWLLYPSVSSAMVHRAPADGAAALVLLIGLLYAAYLLIWRAAYAAAPKPMRESRLNLALGVFPGLIDGAIMVALALTILATVPSDRVPRDAIAASRLGGPLLEAGGMAQAALLDAFGGALRSMVPLRTVEPAEGERVRLPFHTAHGKVDPALETGMLALVNGERRKRGIPALRWDDRLRVVARGHSADMLRRGYFSHYSPEGKTVADRLEAHRMRFVAVGENLALAPTLKIAHQGLMESPGHRANLLRPGFTHIGIGILVARPYGIMITQVFATEPR